MINATYIQTGKANMIFKNFVTSPVFVFYLPDDAVTGFILSNITAVLMGVVVSMNVYVFRHSKGLKITAASFFSRVNFKRAIKHMC